MSLRESETLTGWTLSQHICLHFWAWLLNTIVITPKSEDKYVQKCSTRQSFIFPKWHYYKIGTLTLLFFLSIDRSATLNLSNSISRLILAIPKRIAVRVFSFFFTGQFDGFWWLRQAKNNQTTHARFFIWQPNISKNFMQILWKLC